MNLKVWELATDANSFEEFCVGFRKMYPNAEDRKAQFMGLDVGAGILAISLFTCYRMFDEERRALAELLNSVAGDSKAAEIANSRLAALRKFKEDLPDFSTSVYSRMEVPGSTSPDFWAELLSITL